MRKDDAARSDEVGGKVADACVTSGDESLVQFVASCVQRSNRESESRSAADRVPAEEEEERVFRTVDQLVEERKSEQAPLSCEGKTGEHKDRTRVQSK